MMLHAKAKAGYRWRAAVDLASLAATDAFALAVVASILTASVPKLGLALAAASG